jgi:tRNA 5-methylaminomethyl-2-thiouridine biosynthesis bifunctional protein
MAISFEPLVPASVAFDAAGTPVSEQYGDVYHAELGALAQAEHVFLKGNQLPFRWRGRDTFTVCETGFGLGQNFLALWQAWRADPERSSRLHMVSFEAHPFSKEDLARVLLPRVPARFAGLAEQLVAVWPAALPGLHRLEFESGALTLTLAFGFVEKLARQLDARVDAYFLDGFAPQKNPEMWSPRLFGQLVRMANAGATAASWCCAGSVRRALTEAGFLVSKAPGFGRKREVTVATLRPSMRRDSASAVRGHSVLVVGGGLAGAGIAHSLALRGHAVTVLDPVFGQGVGASHKGHRSAALTPLISRDDDIRARLSRAGTLRALHRWQTLAEPARPLRCGALELATDPQDALERQTTLAHLSFPDSWVSWLEPEEASRRAGLSLARGGVFFTDGQLVRPEPLIEALLGRPGIRCQAVQVGSLEQSGPGQWLVRDAAGRELARASTLVLANAVQAKTLLAATPYTAALPKLFAMQALSGQVSHFSAPDTARLNPQLILGGVGYCLPAVDQICVGGSTYDADALVSSVTDRGHGEVIDKLNMLLNVSVSELRSALHNSGGWAGWRAVAAGRLPLIGELAQAPGLWLACGYGSRGLTWSALAGDIIAARLNHEPAPVERDLLRAIAPR